MQLLSWTVMVLATAWSAVWPMWAVAAFAFLLIGVFRRTLRRRKIQARSVTVRQLRTELWFSFLTLSSGSLIGLSIEWLITHGLAEVPTGPVSPLRIAGEFLIYFVLFDAYFYFLHRAMHTRALYWAHKIHHRSVAPDPLSAFSFHPVEGLLTGGFIIVMAVVFHVHLYTLIAANAYGILSSVLIHSGYEVFPRWWYENRLTRWYITPTFHDRHHARFRYNFGGFLTVWDRLLGTTAPGFDAEYKQGT